MRRQPASRVGVVVLYNESQRLIKGEERDMLAEKDVVSCASVIAESLKDHYEVVQVPIFTDVEKALAPYPPTQWMVFNLGEGIEGRLFECARIAWALEAMGYCFTGAGGYTLALTCHKEQTKHHLRKANIRSPKSWLFRESSEVKGNLKFPLIVKPLVEDGSLGIGCDAVVSNLKKLKERVDYIYDKYRQIALVEEFIIGREFNISLWNNPPNVLPLYEIDFSDYKDPCKQIVSFEAKWEEESFDYHHTPGVCPALVDSQMAKKLTQISLDTWNILGCKDYARIDVRIDQQENPYVIEVNCNPDLSPEAGFFRSVNIAGYSYQQMILNLVEFAYQSFNFCTQSSYD
jgi:D-alanine-D-alanine ligase